MDEKKNVSLQVVSQDGENFSAEISGSGGGLVGAVASAVLTVADAFKVSPLQILSDVTKDVVCNMK